MLNFRNVWPSGGGRNEFFEATFLEMLVQTPTLDLLQHFVELRLRDGFIDEALAAREFAVVPIPVLEFGWHRHFPERKIFRQVGLECYLGALERLEVFGQNPWLHVIGHPP